MRTWSMENFEFYQKDFEVLLNKISGKTHSPMTTAFLVSFLFQSPQISNLGVLSRLMNMTQKQKSIG